MHNAPPVVYPLGRSRFQGALLFALWLSGAGVVALWWSGGADVSWRPLTAFAAVVLAGMAALHGWRRAPAGQLRWDGQVWFWQNQACRDAAMYRTLSVALDLQRVLLLRLEDETQASLWLWAERRSMPERWMDLRRAVYSRRKASTPAKPPEPLSAAADFSADARPPRPHS